MGRWRHRERFIKNYRYIEETGNWICTNNLSDSYAMEVEYDYRCEDYEERE